MNKGTIPSLEIDLILAHILKKSREYVLAHLDISLNKDQRQRFRKMIKRRQNHEPLAYILGRKEFYGLDFKVNKNVLIPRPETELFVEEIIKFKPKNENIIDIGTGSGNIVVTLAKNIKEKNIFFGIDISEKALNVARFNAKKHKIDKKIRFIKSDLLNNKKLINELKNKNLIITANLPYLSQKIYNSTPPDIKNFEPKSALLSGENGLDHYKKLLKQIKLLSVYCSLFTVRCFLEISPEQKPRITKIIKKYLPSCRLEFKKDLAQKWRLAIIKL